MEKAKNVTVLCEDAAHWSFAKQFANGLGIDTSEWHAAQRGSFSLVAKNFPGELKAFRAHFRRTNRARLIVIIDKDDNNSISLLEKECKAQNVEFRLDGEKVAFFFPDRAIENWYWFIERLEAVDGVALDVNYKKAEKDKSLVRQFARNCLGADHSSFPDSMARSCGEVRNRVL